MDRFVRHATPIGVFDEFAFQASLCPWDMNRDALRVHLFSELGLLCVPMCGVYGDNYHPALPKVLLELPLVKNPSLVRKLPDRIQEMLEFLQEGDEDHIRMFIMIHDELPPSECQHFLCTQTNEINMIYHTWLYDGMDLTEDSDVQESVYMGIFESDGLFEAHMDIDAPLAGIPIEDFGERLVSIHSLCFSPANAQFARMEGMDVCSWFAAARFGNRAVISYHVLPQTEGLVRQIDEILTNETCQTLQDLHDGLGTIPELTPTHTRFFGLIQSCLSSSIEPSR